MGLSSATDIMVDVINGINGKLQTKDKKVVYRALGKSLMNDDWDCQEEPRGIDMAYDEVYAEWFPSKENELD